MEYITTKEAAAKWGISTVRITVLANEGRIPGAQRLGRSWLIPASATKPSELKPYQGKPIKKDCMENDNFSFPLYHFRPDWSHLDKAQLSKQQQLLLEAETAVMECRFDDAATLLESILQKPEDIAAELAAIWHLGISFIAMNKTTDFSRIFLRLQLLLSEDFPHREDFAIIYDCLNTYIETVDYVANNGNYNTSVHNQSIPLTCMLIGYSQLAKEIITPGTANIPMLELGLRFLQTTSANVVIEMMHIYLMCIYSFRQNMADAERHAKLAVQIAYENKLYFPLVTYFRYSTAILSPIIEQYPKEFQDYCTQSAEQFDTNYSSFLISINENAIISKLNDSDVPYICAVLMNLPNSTIAERLSISPKTVKRRLEKIYEKFGVTNKKELKEHLRAYM